jgi:hypothetical protein
MGRQEVFLQKGGSVGLTCMEMTEHARVRVRQPGVKRSLLDCLLAYGRYEPDHSGCQLVTFDSKAMDDISRYESRELKTRAADSARLYAVMALVQATSLGSIFDTNNTGIKK